MENMVKSDIMSQIYLSNFIYYRRVMGIKQLSKVVADIAPGAIKQQEMKVIITLI